MVDTITTPLSTATPNRAMKPTAAERFRFIPRAQSMAMPPIKAKGTAQRISRAWRIDVKVA